MFASACSSTSESTEPDPTTTTTSSTEAAPGDDVDAGQDGDDGAGASVPAETVPNDDASVDTVPDDAVPDDNAPVDEDPEPTAVNATSGLAATGDLQCALTDNAFHFELVMTNESPEGVRIIGNTELTFADGSTTSQFITIQAIAPGETLRELLFTGAREADQPPTGCSVSQLAVEPTPIYTNDLDDLSDCVVIDNGTGAVILEVTITNGAESVDAFYAGVAAIQNEANERRATALFTSSDQGGDLPAGESLRVSRGPATPVRFEPGLTCRPTSLRKATGIGESFFDSGTTGSLSSDLGFATGSAVLTRDAEVVLQGPLSIINERHDGPVCIEGFADSVGNDADNLSLSEARAEAVAAFFTNAGVTNEIVTVGYGETRSTADNVDDPTQRRVDITLGACPA